MKALEKPEVSPAELARALNEFFLEHPHAAFLEDGRVLFEMAVSRYSISADHGRCVLHLWSEERNMVRTVLGLEERKERLRIRVRRLGTHRPQSLEVVKDRDLRTPATRALSRSRYLQLLERLLSRHFNEFKVENLSTAMDLEHSFGPAYARGLLVRGQQCWALIGVNADENQATIDGVLTLGILWLAYCREHLIGKRVCQGLKVVLPAGSGATTQIRMAWLNRELAQWELYEAGIARDDLVRIDTAGQGNLKMRLVHAFNPEAAIERAQDGLTRLMALLPLAMRLHVTMVPRSANEVALCLYGLKFARVCQGFVADSFVRQANVTFGAGPNETPLQEETEPVFAELMQRLFESRHPGGNARNPLYRLQPESWLQSVIAADLRQIDDTLGGNPVYHQVPAFAAADRAMLDLLTATRDGRLAILELKADEDLHFPLQGLDYWIRVHSLHQQANQDGALKQNGYFPGIELQAAPPLIYYVVPALRVHPSMATILRYLSPSITWTLVALNESWRTKPTVVFRKRGGAPESIT
ncbi:MAG TPA: hypothetical protein VMB49_09030 [Acidobacteriaceae bacterium]|nr:hypothetical protein [Acidobacteriaceae bacterium]